MKRTPQDDDNFVAEFASQLRRRYDTAKRRGASNEEFARSIGVKRAQLDKYLAGGPMPSVRTVALAYRNHKIAVPYAATPTGPVVGGKARKKRPTASSQLTLPFTVLAEVPGKVDVKLQPLSARRFELRLTLRRGPSVAS